MVRKEMRDPKEAVELLRLWQSIRTGANRERLLDYARQLVVS